MHNFRGGIPILIKITIWREIWERELHGDLVKVGFTRFIRQSLPWIAQALHQFRKLGASPQEAFVIVGFLVWSITQETLKSPTIHRSVETLKLAVGKMMGKNDSRQQILVHYIPTSSVWHPANDMLITRITKNRMQLRRKVQIGIPPLLSLVLPFVGCYLYL